MNNYKNTIKVTDKQKEQIYKDVIFRMLNASKPPEQSELVNKMKLSSKLNEYEIRAIYSLASYIKIAHECGTIKKELSDFFNLSEYCINDKGNLLLFVKETVKDIQEWEYIMHGEWSFHLGLIFKRLTGYKPYEDVQELKPETDVKKGVIINFQDWFQH